MVIAISDAIASRNAAAARRNPRCIVVRTRYVWRWSRFRLGTDEVVSEEFETISRSSRVLRRYSSPRCDRPHDREHRDRIRGHAHHAGGWHTRRYVGPVCRPDRHAGRAGGRCGRPLATRLRQRTGVGRRQRHRRRWRTPGDALEGGTPCSSSAAPTSSAGGVPRGGARTDLAECGGSPGVPRAMIELRRDNDAAGRRDRQRRSPPSGGGGGAIHAAAGRSPEPALTHCCPAAPCSRPGIASPRAT
jgi:hypothetical protein